MGYFSSSVLVLVTSVIVVWLPKMLEKRLPLKGEGFAAPGWRKVADVFRDQLDSGEQHGGGISVYHKGQLVVEFTGGYAHYESEWAWEKDTLSCYFSTTKVAASVVMALLVHRGVLDYKKPVSDYWPEFGQNGKHKITVEQLLSHQAGLAAIDAEFSAFDMVKEPEKLSALLAAQKPNWVPGEGHGYHGFTLGLFEDQLVRRLDPLHRSLAQFFAEEIAQPFGIDFFIGLPQEEHYRVAYQYPYELSPMDLLQAPAYWSAALALFTDPDSIISRAVSNPPEIDKPMMNNPHYQELPSAATHGFGTVMSIGKLMGILSNQGMDLHGRTLLPMPLIHQLQEPLTSGYDLVLFMNLTYGRGVTIKENPLGHFIFGAPGAGGQIGFADVHYGLGWSHLTNHPSVFAMGDDPQYLALERAIYECAMNIATDEAGP